MDTDAPESTKESEETTSPSETEEIPTEKSDSKSPLGYILLILFAVGAVGAYYVLKIRPGKDMEDEEDETAYGGEEQPDDINDALEEEAETTESEKEDAPELSEEGTNSDENIPFQDYPEIEEDADEKQ